jgi:hypothetical protein
VLITRGRTLGHRRGRGQSVHALCKSSSFSLVNRGVSQAVFGLNGTSAVFSRCPLGARECVYADRCTCVYIVRFATRVIIYFV